MNCHLDNFTMHPFRGLRDVTLGGLAPVNILIGANNSGKTSVLEALAIFCRPFDIYEWLSILRRRENSHLEDLISGQLMWLFAPETDGRRIIRLTGCGRYPVSVVAARFHANTGMPIISAVERSNEDGGPVYEEVRERLGAQLELAVTKRGPDGDENRKYVFQLWNERPDAGVFPERLDELPVRTLTPFTHRLERTQVIGLSGATVDGWKQDCVELLRGIDPSILDLQIISPKGLRPEVAVKYAEFGVVPLSTLGDGIRRIVLLALSVPSVRNGILLIDEIETAIHTSALSKVFSWLVAACKTHDVQLFATTHSLEAVDALLNSSNGHLDELAAFKLNLASDRNRVQRMGGDLIKRLREERGLDLR